MRVGTRSTRSSPTDPPSRFSPVTADTRAPLAFSCPTSLRAPTPLSSREPKGERPMPKTATPPKPKVEPAPAPPPVPEFMPGRARTHRILDIETIVDAKGNGRTLADLTAADRELVESVRRHGILEPILVRPTGQDDYEQSEIVAGHRRTDAAREAGLKDVPAIVFADMTEGEAAEARLVENLHRADLHPLEEADGYAALLQEAKATVPEIAARVGK